MNIYVQLEKNANKRSSSPLILVGSCQELGPGAASCGVGATPGRGGEGRGGKPVELPSGLPQLKSGRSLRRKEPGCPRLTQLQAWDTCEDLEA